MSYSEAVKKVGRGRWGKDPERSDVSSRSVPVQRDKPTSGICFSNIGFFAFIAMAINCTVRMEQ